MTFNLFKPNLMKLSRFDFLNLNKNRDAVIDAAPATPVPPVTSYKANQLAAALHPKFQELVVTEINERTGVKSFTLSSSDGKPVAYFSAGQYLSVMVKIDDKTYCRPYSISSSPKESLAGKYVITVKRVQDGIVSPYILDNFKIGTKVITSAPLGVFTYEPLRDAKTIVGVAGGSGITPFHSLAKAIADGDEDCNLVLLYGSRTKADILFGDDFDAIMAKTNKFRVVHVLSDEDAEGAEKGFITAELIKKYAPQNEPYSVFLCGPQKMYEFVDGELAKMDIKPKYIRHELFGEYRNPDLNGDYPRGAIGKVFALSVTVCGKTSSIQCRYNETLLNAMERQGLTPPSDCRSGKCGWCRSQLLSGKVYIPKEVDGRRAADLQFGYVHPCCTFPVSDVAIDVPPMGK